MLFDKQTAQSLSSDNAKAWIIGLEDNNRDWLLLGRRGSGALELLAGLWRQNRDRSERTSFEYDDPHNSKTISSWPSLQHIVNIYKYFRATIPKTID